MKPTIVVTVGDPSGIGPEITERALRDPLIRQLADWEVLGVHRKKKWNRKEAGLYSFRALEEAVSGLKSGRFQALVTGPVSKTNLKMAGFPFPGQTEYLAHAFKTKQHAMMLAGKDLRVVLVSIHLPLKKAISSLRARAIVEKIGLTSRSLRTDFGIQKPRIAVCGLNPHAGEKGAFGSEEEKIIIPAIKAANKLGINTLGPFAPDTIFHWAIQGRYDAVICHYHDQGLIALKTHDFYGGVNMTLGLPIVRTSPDHGPAFDIAGQKKADLQSMKQAMKLAHGVWKRRLAKSMEFA